MQKNWLETMLARNKECAYLVRFGSPETVRDYQTRVPVVNYETFAPFVHEVSFGKSDVLFKGRPIAYERTGGSQSGGKLIAYTQEGLFDFQADLLPWLAHTLKRYDIQNEVYFAISPSTRPKEMMGDIPVGLPDTAYLGEKMGAWLLKKSAVPFFVSQISSVTKWKKETLRYLQDAQSLEFISVWSPTFLLDLLDEIPHCHFPQLKLVSAWKSAGAAPFAQALARRLPHAPIQAKGLLASEAMMTVLNEDEEPVPARHVFLEYETMSGQYCLEDELNVGETYGVIITSANGLYRYRMGDFVLCTGRSKELRPILEFLGRGHLVCDLVGEKLSDAFVGHSLQKAGIHTPVFLIPDYQQRAYVVVATLQNPPADLAALEKALLDNPQYAYARKIGQLAPLSSLAHKAPFEAVVQHLCAKGVRRSDIKPLFLRKEAFWLPLFQGKTPL